MKKFLSDIFSVAQKVLFNNFTNSSPSNGELWFDGTNFRLREGGVSKAIVSTADIISIANGGTGVALTDPNADRVLFWDDSAGQFTWLTIGSGLSISGTTITASASVTDVTTAIGGSIIKRKSASESVSSSSALQNDNHFTFSVEANATYMIDMALYISAGGGGFKCDFTMPAGATLNYGGNYSTTAQNFNITAGTPFSTVSSASTQTPSCFFGLLTVAGTSGTLQFQWTQGSGNATATVLQQNSIMRLTKVA